MSRRKTREPKEENVTLGPAVRDGEHVFGVAHIFASFNDTFIVSIIIGLNLIYIYFFVFKFYSFESLKCVLYGMQHVTDLSGRETLVRITGTVPSLGLKIDVLFIVCLF